MLHNIQIEIKSDGIYFYLKFSNFEINSIYLPIKNATREMAEQMAHLALLVDMHNRVDDKYNDNPVYDLQDINRFSFKDEPNSPGAS